MHALTLHQHLIGRQGSRRDLNTPALIVDLAALERNIAMMAALAAKAGVTLRPHAKTHKSVQIARRQIAAGAVGVCCAKLGEAEALADGGIENILITSPVVGPAAVERLAALAARSPGLMTAADHPDAVDALAASGAAIKVLVDIDPGIHRTGVADGDAAVALARRIARAPNLAFGGVQFYCGSQQHIEAFDARREAIIERTAYLQAIVRALGGAGLAPTISANHPFLVTVDAGFKAFSTEDGSPPILAGALEGSTYHFMGDEHGCVIPPRGEAPPKLGETVTFAAPHCDPTVNLYEAYHVVRDDTLADIWPIEGRGRSA